MATFARLYADDLGESHLESIEQSVIAVEVPAAVSFVVVPHGEANLGWHPAPRRQLVVWLHGESEIEASDGFRHPIGPGDCLLVEDVHGKGHRNHHRGEVHVMFVHLVERP